MWGDKKTETPAKTPLPQQSKPSTPFATPITGEVKTMAPLDSPYPATTSSGGTARLGASLHVKGEITGNEDLHIDGTVEGLVHLEDRKLTIGASAKVTADIIAREVAVFGNVKGNASARPYRDQEGRFGGRGFDDCSDHDRGRRVLQGLDRDRQDWRRFVQQR